MTTHDLHARHWRYVRRILPRYGIPAGEVPDVAQEVWKTVHQRIGTYDPEKHKSWRAWITGILRRCAANHRRAADRPDGMPDSFAELVPAPGLDAEQIAVLRKLIGTIPNGDNRDALLLQLEGFSVAEIAVIQGVTPSAVEKRLYMARQHLKGDDEKKAGAFLGFGSLEALAEALRPKDELPDEVGEQEWERIAEAIRQQEGAPADEGPPSSSIPSPAPVPVLPPVTPGLVVMGKAKLAIVLGAVFLGGAGTGIGAMWAWQALRTPREAPAIQAPPTPTALRTAPPVAPSGAAAPPAPPSSSPRPVVARSSLARPTTPAAAPPSSGDGSSVLLLMQMERAIEQKRFADALQLAEQHARLFGGKHKRERELAQGRALKGRDRETHPAGPSR